MSRELTANEELLRQTGMYSAGLQRQLTECRQYLARIVERGTALSNNVGGAASSLQSYKLDVSQTDPVCLEAVVLNALTALNKRFLMMEAAATSKLLICSGNEVKAKLLSYIVVNDSSNDKISNALHLIT